MPTKGPLPFLQVVRAATPVAGAEFTLSAPGQGIWRVISLAFVFTTSAAVANRRISLRADDQTDTWFATVATVDVAAAQTVVGGAYGGSPAAGVGTSAITLALPTDGLLLMPGYRVRSVTAGIDVADAYTAIRAQVMEYPEGPASEYLPGIWTQVGEMG